MLVIEQKRVIINENETITISFHQFNLILSFTKLKLCFWNCYCYFLYKTVLKFSLAKCQSVIKILSKMLTQTQLRLRRNIVSLVSDSIFLKIANKQIE